MARANLNKSEVFLTNNTAASIFYEENLVSQCAHLEVFLLSKFGSERGFQLMQILGLLGMYFDAVVVEVKTSSLLFRLALTIL